jgi:hypothetical protein
MEPMYYAEMSKTPYKDGDVIIDLDIDLAQPLLENNNLIKKIVVRGKDFQEVYDKLDKKLTAKEKEGNILIFMTVSDDLTPESISFGGWKISENIMSKDSLVIWCASKGKNYKLNCWLS